MIADDLDLGFLSERWRKLIRRSHGLGKSNQPTHAEVCIISHLSGDLRSGNICIDRSEAFADYRKQLLPCDECQACCRPSRSSSRFVSPKSARVGTPTSLRRRCRPTGRTTSDGGRPCLGQLQESGEFRHDLYYRISGVVLELPPLRERSEDIPELARVFLTRFAQLHRLGTVRMDPSVTNHLKSLPWLGNVRQLRHAVEHAAIFADDGCIELRDLPASRLIDKGCDATVRSRFDQVESEMIITAMQRYGGNKKRVAEALGISRSYLYKRLTA